MNGSVIHQRICVCVHQSLCMPLEICIQEQDCTCDILDDKNETRKRNALDETYKMYIVVHRSDLTSPAKCYVLFAIAPQYVLKIPIYRDFFSQC